MRFRRFAPILAGASLASAVLVALLLPAAVAAAQDANPPGTNQYGYHVLQSVDLGGHVSDYSGSSAMYDTLVNLQTGPRLLDETLDMQPLAGSKHFLFDRLFTASSGYGGDPYDSSMLRMSKGRLYEFDGLFRRDRQYFDDDLFDNPLVPPGLVSNGYTFPQVRQSPHLFNTVRRMTDANLTLLPMSRFSLHAGYSQNVMEGPSFSSIHEGIEGLLLQNWRNSTEVWRVGVDWKPRQQTVLGYDEVIEHYKGDTNWVLSGLNLQLSNGTPVSLGFDNTTVPSCGNHLPAIQDDTTTPPTANATCNGYLRYSRSAPTRTLFPTEEFHFQSSDIPKVQMNGRVLYTGASMNLPNYGEFFNGFNARGATREFTVSGSAKARRVNTTGDFGLVWQFAPRLSLTEQYDFQNYRSPGSDNYLQTTYTGTSMLSAPSTTGTTSSTSDAYFLGQKMQENTILANWHVAPGATVSLGWRYRTRHILRRSPDTDIIDIHQQGALLGAELHPLPAWRVYGDVEIGYADNAYVPLDPRQFQRYQMRTTYRHKDWATVSGSFEDVENRDNVLYVHHLDHDRSATAGADLTPNSRYGFDLNYGYLDFFTVTDECYATTPAGPGTPASPSPACIANGTPYYANGYYDSPTQYGSLGIHYAPVKRLRTGLGYRMTAIDGTTVAINPRQVPGSLQSQYQVPWADAAWMVRDGWGFRADWNYYSYGEGSPVGPTLPRSFRGNVYTLGMHYEF